MKHFTCNQEDINYSIDIILQDKDILIQCIISDKNKYSSVFNLEKLKKIDKLFGGFPPLSLNEIYDILCKYFEENKVTIQAFNSKVIIEIEKDYKPDMINMIFELERDKINSINDNQKNIRLNNNMNNQIMDIYNNNGNLMNNNNNSNNITNIMINKLNNTNNNNIILNENNYNDNMNNNGNMNNNNINIIVNMNNNKSSQTSTKFFNHIDSNNYNGDMPNNMNIYGNINNNKYNNCNQDCNNYNNNFNNNNNHNNKNMNYLTKNINNNMNNNCNMNYNNNLMGNIINENLKDQENMENYGGLYNENIDNDNFINSNNIYNLLENLNKNNNNKNNHFNKKQIEINSSLNVRFAQPKKNQKGQTIDLNCFLKFLLIKILTNKKKENISKYECLKNVEEVIKLIKNNQDFKEDINSKKEINILNYLKYLDNKNLDKNSLLEKLFTEKKKLKDDILDYWKFLSTYEEYNSGFEHQFFEDLKKCNLDYSLVDMKILERDNPEEYEQKKNECKNMKKMKVYLLSKINFDFNNLNMQLEYSNESTFGRGFYFSDSIEYVLRYQKDDVPKIDENFSLMICEIFYDEEKLKEFDKNSSQNSSSEDKEKVEPNGLKKIEIFHLNNNNSKIIISNEYVLSEKFQIFPLYIFTLRRNEYYVLHRDPNFAGKDHYSKDLEDIKLRNLKYSNNKNFYFESSTEEALQLVLKKKNVKVILITSYGFDGSGMRFAEISKKILQKNDEIVLFFSNNTNHLKSIANSSNCFYIQNPDTYEECISNYNYYGLMKLKEKIEKDYNIQLNNIFLNILNHSNCDDDLKFSDFDDNNDCIYFRSVHILNPDKSLYLSMTKEGKVIKSKKECLWKITVQNNNITLFSNGFYLNIDKNKEIAIGSKEMKKWTFDKANNDYYFINTEEGKNNYLSMEEDEDIKVNKEALINNYSKFNLIDIYN